ALSMLEEMVQRDWHHPSILMWSVNNECATDTKEGLDFNRLLVNRARELDHTRLVTFATDRPLTDLTLSLYDVIGINKYYGWYGGKVEGFAQFLEDYHEYAATQGAEDKPIIMSEFGGAGIFGDVGWEDERMFSEDYQAHILEESLRIFRSDPKIVGTYIWQFADIRSDTIRFRDRARGFNNKGILNEYRKPKQAFKTVRSIYSEGPPQH
ncbi:MAG: glycoside hydrolase family 2 TIM barrel-domain containing protein, partial [Bacilli bacterium]